MWVVLSLHGTPGGRFALEFDLNGDCSRLVRRPCAKVRTYSWASTSVLTSDSGCRRALRQGFRHTPSACTTIIRCYRKTDFNCNGKIFREVLLERVLLLERISVRNDDLWPSTSCESGLSQSAQPPRDRARIAESKPVSGVLLVRRQRHPLSNVVTRTM